MTYHMARLRGAEMERPRLTATTSSTTLDKDILLELGKIKRNFSSRLYESLMREPESQIMFWGKDGESFYVDAELFEKNVMHAFPGLVAIPSFKNFLRQLKCYEFDNLGETDLGYQWFSNPYFQKNKEELLPKLKMHKSGNFTRKKSLSETPISRKKSWIDMLEIPVEYSPIDGRKRQSNRIKRRSQKMENDDSIPPQTPMKKSKIIGVCDAEVQTDVSMKAFCRLDPTDPVISALIAIVTGNFPQAAATANNVNHTNQMMIEREISYSEMYSGYGSQPNESLDHSALTCSDDSTGFNGHQLPPLHQLSYENVYCKEEGTSYTVL